MNKFIVSIDLLRPHAVQYAACDERPRVYVQPVQRTTSGRTVELRDYKVPPGALSKWPLPTFYPRAQFFKTNKGPQSARLILERPRHSLGLRIISQNSSTSVFSEAVIFGRPRRPGARALSLLLFVIC